jgi:hypothetical protein
VCVAGAALTKYPANIQRVQVTSATMPGGVSRAPDGPDIRPWASGAGPIAGSERQTTH